MRMRRLILFTLIVTLALVVLGGVQPTMAQHASSREAIVGNRTDAAGLYLMYSARAAVVAASPGDVTFVTDYAGTEVVEATVHIRPRTLNLKSKGKWVIARIELPEGYDVGDIVDTVWLEDTIESLRTWISDDSDDDDIPSLVVMFSRQELIEYLIEYLDGSTRGKVTLVTLTVSGVSDGTPFGGSDTIRVIKPGGK